MFTNTELSGFDYQNRWAGNCAQRSLIHSLLLLGIPISEGVAHQKTGVPKYKTLIRGTSLSALKKSIHRCGCTPYIYEENSKNIRKKIDEFLNAGIPVIINAQEGTHWGVLAGKESFDYYYWIDSDDWDLYGCSHWSKIREWMENDSTYLIIGIRPNDEKLFECSTVKNFAEVYSFLIADDDLARYWGWYLDILVGIFDAPTKGQQDISAEEFFTTHAQSVIDNLYWRHGESDKKYIKWEFENFQKVAMAHKFSVSVSQEIKAVIAVTAAMAYTILS